MRTVLLAVALSAGCNVQYPPKANVDKARAAAEEFEKQSNAEEAERKKRADEQREARISDPGSISIEESDALIAKLQGANPFARKDAASDLARAKSIRAVPALIDALGAETNDETCIAIVQALESLNDRRATEPLVAAMAATGRSDDARAAAFDTLVRFSSATRFLPQIRELRKSVTDEQVVARVQRFLDTYDR